VAVVLTSGSLSLRMVIGTILRAFLLSLNFDISLKTVHVP
jgi:hypothetical protein